MSEPPPLPDADDEHHPADATGQVEFPCQQCGAMMAFDPAAQTIKCSYCGHENHIPQSEDEIEEYDYHAHLAQLQANENTTETTTVKCTSCSAETTLAPNIVSDDCPYCGSAIVAQKKTTKQIRPKSVLPFAITRAEALERFRDWLQRLWFAPGLLKLYARSESTHLQGIYVPYWTYDSNTTSFYRGERGTNYYVTQTYTTTENGRTVTKTRRVRRIRWRSISGVVYDTFDDILVLASRSLPKKLADRLTPWDLHELCPFDEHYLAGYKTETYQVPLDVGFDEAKHIMAGHIRSHVRRAIGGDHQRVHGVSTQHNNVTFKHILLPIWISTYRFQNKVYHFLVNARTGEVHGQRPWSGWKIVGAILLIAVIAVVVGLLVALLSGHFAR